MALTLYDKLTPSGDFPLVKAADVEMSDGTRFDEFLDGKEAEILDLGTRVYALELKDAQFEFAAETAFRQVEELSNRVTTLEESDALPEVDADDNGKTLTVVGGKWEVVLPSGAAPATAVDLTNFEANGTIVETYADGSTIEYQMRFDTDGNPVEITDSNGNVTVLTW